MELHDRTIQQFELVVQNRATVLRQRLRKIQDHRTQAARDLEVLSTIEPYFAERHLHEVLPVRLVKHHAQMTGRVYYPFILKMTLANKAKKSLELINGKDGGCRIVDGFRQRLDFCPSRYQVKGKPKCAGTSFTR